jgi:hypothetical protein
MAMKLRSLFALFALFSTILPAGCGGENQRQIDVNDFRVNTTDASELFFKNVRSTYYKVEENEAAGLRIYRKNSWEGTRAILPLAIVVSWKQDKAFVLVEPKEPLSATDPITIHWKNEAEGSKGTIQVTLNNHKAHFELAVALYNKILEECSFMLEHGGSEITILDTEEKRESFRVSMYDYFRLVEFF